MKGRTTGATRVLQAVLLASQLCLDYQQTFHHPVRKSRALLRRHPEQTLVPDEFTV